MKQKVGMVVMLVGILLLIRPNMNVVDLFEVCSYFCVRYWPILIICIGVYMQSTHKTKRRRR